MKKTILAVVLLFLATMSYAIDCNTTVSDDAHVFGDKTAEIISGGNELNRLGADVRVISTGLNGAGNLDIAVNNIRQNCPSWQSPNRGMKSTLLILAVAPQERKMGIYYGDSMRGAFDDQVNSIRSEAMGPHFKNAEWAEGVIAGEQRLTKSLKTFKAGTSTVNEAVDLSGLWATMKWLLFVLALGGLVWIFIALARGRRDRQTSRLRAQLSAKTAYAQAADMLNSMTEKYVTDSSFAYQQERFTNYANQLSFDPNDNSRTQVEYETMRDIYKGIVDALARISSPRNSASSIPPTTPSAVPPTHEHHKKKQPYVPPAPAPSAPVRETVVVQDNSNDFATGVVLGSLLNDRRDPEPEPERHYHRDPDPEPEKTSSSWVGGSSDYSSSSSSSSDFGGGSSDFGSSSSDSGGGGSSDF